MRKKKSRKRVRFKTITIKVTARQKRSLDNFCRLRRTTNNKIIKRSIRPLLENYSGLSISNGNGNVKVNQLQLFDIE